MPADSYAAAIPVGELSRGRPSGARGEQGSGTQNPTLRGSVAAQGNRIDDTTLIREAQRGNRAAFEVLVRHYDQSVLRLALHLTGSEADSQDIQQDAFLKAYKNLGSFRFECSFYTWIYRIVTTLPRPSAEAKCSEGRRSRNHRSPGEEYNMLEQVVDGRSGANPERDLMRRELGRKIGAALYLTPANGWSSVKHYHGLKLRTVGEMLNTGRDR
jgi:RNA polymerase sigma-70 factor (ECF subfamily)